METMYLSSRSPSINTVRWVYDDDLLFLATWPEHYPPEVYITFRVELSVRTDQRRILTSTCPIHFVHVPSFSRCHSSLIHFSLFVYIFDSFWYLHPYFLSYSYNLNSEKHQNTEQWCTNPTIHLSRPSSPVGQRRARLWRRGLTISITRCVRILCKSGKEGNVCHSW